VDKWIGLLVSVAIVGVAAWLMVRSWRRRTRRDESLTSYPLPATLGSFVLETEVLYVATTPTGQPLERLALNGLGFRGAARIEIAPEGVVLRVAGEAASFLPADRVIGAGPDTVAPHVDSYLRARYPGDSARIIAAVNDIAAARAASRPEKESEASDD
jgi:hypothetical protein